MFLLTNQLLILLSSFCKVMSLLSAFKILFIFGSLEFKNHVYLCGFLCLTHLYFIELLGFLDDVFKKSMNFPVIIYSDVLSAAFHISFLNFHNEYIGMIDSIPQDSKTLFSFLYSFSFLLLHLIDIIVISWSFLVPSYFLKSVEKLY